jgi:WD40 repeat protein
MSETPELTPARQANRTPPCLKESSMRVLLFVSLLVGVGAVVCVAAPPAGPMIQKWIDQLGSKDLKARTSAARALTDLGEEAITPLRWTIKTHPDVDVRLRAAVVAATIQKQLTGVQVVYKASGWVCRCAVTPDGKKVVCLGDSIRVYELSTGKELLRFARGSFAWGLSVSRDGKHILASAPDHSVRLYELETGKEIHRFPPHAGEVWLAALSPDGKQAVTGALDRQIHVWDTTTGKRIRSFENVTDYPRCGVFSSDGKKIAIGHFDGGNFLTSKATVRIWDVETGKVIASGTGHTGAITAVVWSPDGRRLATSSFDRTVRLWDATTLKQQMSLTVSDQPSDGVTFTRDGKRLVTAGWGSDHAVKVWDIASGKELRRYEGHTESVLCVVVTPDGKHFLSSARDGTLRLWPLPH